MPTFATPEPISVDIELDVGDVKIVAGDRSDTVVTVSQPDPASSLAIQAAQRVQVDHSAGVLKIKQSVPWHHKLNQSLDTAIVTITVELPAGSHVRGKTALGTFVSEGRLGACEFTS